MYSSYLIFPRVSLLLSPLGFYVVYIHASHCDFARGCNAANEKHRCPKIGTHVLVSSGHFVPTDTLRNYRRGCAQFIGCTYASAPRTDLSARGMARHGGLATPAAGGGHCSASATGRVSTTTDESGKGCLLRRGYYVGARHVCKSSPSLYGGRAVGMGRRLPDSSTSTGWADWASAAIVTTYPTFCPRAEKLESTTPFYAWRARTTRRTRMYAFCSGRLKKKMSRLARCVIWLG